MTELKKSFFADEPVDAHKKLTERAWPYIKSLIFAGHSVKITVDVGTRTLDQNAAQWPYLLAWEQGKEACINGVMQKVSKEDWKDILTGAHNGESRVAVFDGRVIMLPQRTSKMGKSVFSDWMEYLVAATAMAGLEPIFKNGGENV